MRVNISLMTGGCPDQGPAIRLPVIQLLHDAAPEQGLQAFRLYPRSGEHIHRRLPDQAEAARILPASQLCFADRAEPAAVDKAFVSVMCFNMVPGTFSWEVSECSILTNFPHSPSGKDLIRYFAVILRIRQACRLIQKAVLRSDDQKCAACGFCLIIFHAKSFFNSIIRYIASLMTWCTIRYVQYLQFRSLISLRMASTAIRMAPSVS